ncbi:putative fructose-bisphosphate aldolase [Colletotrichum sp. SAR 10_99]|nr:putative fructose-bisphosphate aldolase [Colletotrichum sp. SAR 10_99]
MVDGSMFEEEENIRYVKSVVDRARKKNMTVEAELGRMEGGEDGLPTVDLESVWTDPDRAAEFVKQTGVKKIHEALGEATPLVLHGTHPLSDEMVKVGMAKGMVKVNQNRNVRNGYHKYLEENCSKAELTTLQVQGVEEYSKGVERLMVEVLGSSGRA